MWESCTGDYIHFIMKYIPENELEVIKLCRICEDYPSDFVLLSMETHQKDGRKTDEEDLVVSSGDVTQNLEKYTENNTIDTGKYDDGRTCKIAQIETKSGTSAEELCTSSSESNANQNIPCEKVEYLVSSSSMHKDNNVQQESSSNNIIAGVSGNSEFHKEATTSLTLDTRTSAYNTLTNTQLEKEIPPPPLLVLHVTGTSSYEIASTETISSTEASDSLQQVDSNIHQEPTDSPTKSWSTTDGYYVPSSGNSSSADMTVNTVTNSNAPGSNTQTVSIVREATITAQNKTQCSTEETLNDPELKQNETVNKTNPIISQGDSTSSSTPQSRRELRKRTTENVSKDPPNESQHSANKTGSASKPGRKRKLKPVGNDASGSSSTPKQKRTIRKKKLKEQNERIEQSEPPPIDLDEEWNIIEKKRLLEALKTDRGRRWWGRLASKVITKNVDQVKHYTEILRAKANNTLPIHLDEVDSPLQAWIIACERLIDCQDDVDAKCIPQVMTIAAVEPTSSKGPESGPNYGRIYSFLSSVLRGQPNMLGLTPLDAKVVLELLHNLETRVFSANSSEQVNFLRTKFKTINKELEQEQIVFAIKELEREIQRSDMTAITSTENQRSTNPQNLASITSTGVPMATTSVVSASGSSIVEQVANEVRTIPRKIVLQGSMQSSLNPVNVPVSLLNLTTKNKH